MEIIRAPYSGFCFGVKQAIETAEKEADKSNEKIYSFGPLIHNKGVTDELEEKGVFIIDTLENLPERSKVIVRSHGIGKWFYDEAASKNIEVIDATCPYVKRIHQLVHNAYEEGKQVVIVGDANHPEVQGINGWCENTAIILNEPTEIIKDNLFVVAQTTIRKDLFDSVVYLLKKINKAVEVNNTICSATSKRQEGCKETALKVDAMLVVGDKKSSNTKKLYEIAKNIVKMLILLMILKIYH